MAFISIQEGQKIKAISFMDVVKTYCEQRNIILIIGDVQYQDEQLANIPPRIELIDSLDSEGNPIQTEVRIMQPEKDQYILGIDLDFSLSHDQRMNNVEKTIADGWISLSQKFTDDFSSNIGESFKIKYDTRFKKWAQTAHDIFKELSRIGCGDANAPVFDIESWRSSFSLNNFSTSIDRVVVQVSLKFSEI